MKIKIECAAGKAMLAARCAETFQKRLPFETDPKGLMSSEFDDGSEFVAHWTRAGTVSVRQIR